MSGLLKQVLRQVTVRRGKLLNKYLLRTLLRRLYDSDRYFILFGEQRSYLEGVDMAVLDKETLTVMLFVIGLDIREVERRRKVVLQEYYEQLRKRIDALLNRFADQEGIEVYFAAFDRDCLHLYCMTYYLKPRRTLTHEQRDLAYRQFRFYEDGSVERIL